jgi:hypothetical protein
MATLSWFRDMAFGTEPDNQKEAMGDLVCRSHGSAFSPHPPLPPPMNRSPWIRFPSLCLPLLLLVPLLASAGAVPISAVFGEDIPLQGTATGSDFIYLFLTGPNLPAQGISLAEGTPVATGVPGSFTRVEVFTDGTWDYTWRTGSVGRVLDPGTYVLYIAEEPRALPDLDDAVYTTQAVVFGAPVETVTVVPPEATESVPPGTMQGGPLLTGMEQSSGQATVTGTPAPTPPARLAPLTLVPLGAAALAILVLRRGR